MPSVTKPEIGDRRTRRLGLAVLAVLVLAAYAPSLGGTFVSDDDRFIVKNPAVQRLSLMNAVKYFTDPKTQAVVGFDIYRPMRTLDYAIDWSIAGDSPLWFRLRNLLYHILAAVLLWALFRRLTGEERPSLATPAFLGAAVFAVHPVHVESVAFISSRGDLLCLCFFTGALLMHLRGRMGVAALLLVPALLSKEVAVMFPAAAWVADGFARRPRRPIWRWYGVYAAVAVAFTGLWLWLVTGAGDTIQRPGWPGGSWLANLVTVGKAHLLYVKQLVLPIDFVFDYHVPSRPVNGLVDLLLAGAGFGVFVVAIVAGRRARFASLWFLALILPVAGILTPVANPTTERWMLLPSVGFCLAAGFLLARVRLRYAVLACFLVLTGSRSLDWRSFDALIDSALPRASAPIPLNVQAFRQLVKAEESRKRRDAHAILETVDEFHRLYREDIVGPEPRTLVVRMLNYRANAYLLLDQPNDALEAAREGMQRTRHNWALRDTAAVALRRLGRTAEAVDMAEEAFRIYDGPRTRRRLAELLYRLGAEQEAGGNRAGALELYRRAWSALPDPAANGRARDAAMRLER